ncbi:hypothetical protein M1146_06125, partial [Patescibacteria group bacterium]|nr:hypothetical protein [Patescibacteria group bacterium]
KPNDFGRLLINFFYFQFICFFYMDIVYSFCQFLVFSFYLFIYVCFKFNYFLGFTFDTTVNKMLTRDNPNFSRERPYEQNRYDRILSQSANFVPTSIEIIGKNYLVFRRR